MEKFFEFAGQLLELELLAFYQEYQLFTILLGVLVFSVPVIYLASLLINVYIKGLVERKMPGYSKLFSSAKLYRRGVQVVYLMYLLACSDFIDQLEISRFTMKIKDAALQIYAIFAIAWVVISAVDVMIALYKKRVLHSRVPVSLYSQITRIVVTICAVLAVVSTGLGLSISSLFTSLGAATALLGFIFRDALMALLSSLQVTHQDILRIGDWVTVANKDIDGTVERINISVVVIRNFDGTTTTVPTETFLQNPVRNWRPMYEKGGRRIKRSIILDMDYVQVCGPETLNIIKSLPGMAEYAQDNPAVFDAESETTNVTLFRLYVDQYLRAHQDIHKEDFTFLIRQLDPTATGLPIELYIFTKDTRWNEHENIQTSIFEHLLAILPKFKLKPFQTVIKLNK